MRNGKMFCANCGEYQDLPMPIRVEMFTAMAKTFNKLHRDCIPTWKEPEFDKTLSVEARASLWMMQGETGMSSKAIWSMMMTGTAKNHFPYDPDDFSRCYKLLKAIPEWRKRMDAMRPISSAWNNLVEHWDELTAMFEENERTEWKKSKKIGMYERMNELITMPDPGQFANG